MTLAYRSRKCGECGHYDAEMANGFTVWALAAGGTSDATMLPVERKGCCRAVPPNVDARGRSVRPHVEPTTAACGSFEEKGEG